MNEYQSISNLEEIIKLSKESINDNYKLNFSIKVNFDIALIDNKILDVHDDALAFQAPKCPNNLQMNHGEYIHKNKDGIKNVINELNAKDTSNRAIISLINQDDIIGSGDKPIPSFMILQFSIENDNELYVTTYFRALEVSKFLRINVEEIRMIIEKIKSEILKISKVNLNILAFRAYKKENINPLKRAEIDLLKSNEIFGLLKTNKSKFIDLLEEKKTKSTVIEYQSFQYIFDWLNDSYSKDDIHKDINKLLVKSKFQELIELSKEIKDLREKTSHSPQIDEKQEKYIKLIDDITMEIRNDS